MTGRLAPYDLLLMPTRPIKAHELPPPNAARELVIEHALEVISNTAPFDITHRPAMAIPCGMSDGLPVSMMLIGKHWDEPTTIERPPHLSRVLLRRSRNPAAHDC